MSENLVLLITAGVLYSILLLLYPAWRVLSLVCARVSVWEQIPNARRVSRTIRVAQGAFIDRTVDVLSPAGLERIDSSIPVRQLVELVT